MPLIISILNPTLNFVASTVASLPILVSQEDTVERIAEENIALSAQDWDSFENSWNFDVHPLILAAEVSDLNSGHKASLSDSYAKWEALCENRFNRLKANEEELNRIFIDIYGLQDELIHRIINC